jgi:U3 small nucleolar RNA-associated protein 6
MWRAYVEMELGFAEGLRRRWGVLGIDIGNEHQGKGKARAQDEGGNGDRDHTVRGEGHSRTELDDADGDDIARKKILDGAIVKSVVSSAAQGTLLIKHCDRN